MSEHARFTPGPYYAGDDTGTDCPNHAGGGLAIIDTGRESDWPIARHVEWNNVPLLTAAPALYESIKECISALTYWKNSLSTPITDAERKAVKELERLIDNAEAACKEAEGGS